MKSLLFVLLVLALTMFAADVSGTWKAAVETPNGTFENIFKFKVDAGKLTGSSSNQMTGESPIADGKIDGETLSFVGNTVLNGNEIKVNYKGKIAGEEIKLTAEVVGMDRTFEMTAKRQSN